MGWLASLGKVSKPIYLSIHPIMQISQPNRNIHLVNKRDDLLRVGSQSRSQGTTVPVPVLKLQFSQTEAINFSWAKKSWAGMRPWRALASGRASEPRPNFPPRASVGTPVRPDSFLTHLDGDAYSSALITPNHNDNNFGRPHS